MQLKNVPSLFGVGFARSIRKLDPRTQASRLREIGKIAKVFTDRGVSPRKARQWLRTKSSKLGDISPLEALGSALTSDAFFDLVGDIIAAAIEAATDWP